MPPNKTRKIVERKALAKRIKIEGVKMSPYTHYEAHSRKCVVSPNDDKSRYLECI